MTHGQELKSNVSVGEVLGTVISVNKDCSYREAAFLGMADGLLLTSGIWGTLMTNSLIPIFLGAGAAGLRRVISLGMVIQEKDKV